MQGFLGKKKPKTGFKIKELSLEDRKRLVGAFLWLLKEDKKQNPALYQLERITK